MFKLAGLFVDITARDDEMKRQIGGLKGQLSTMGVAIGTAAGNLAASAISGAASALAGFISRGISGAVNLAETVSKVNTVFGDSAGIITGQAESMAKAFGLPKQAILDAAASIGLVGKAAGQSQAASADMAATMAKLAADASSFYNVPLDQALEKIRAGLVGESEPLRAFGVLLNEESVAAEALALGLAKSKKEIDDQAKVAARASLIQKGLADASGDLERTAGSTANQWRKLTGTLENLAVSVGETLSPAIASLATLAADAATGLVAAFESSRETFRSFSDGVVEAVATIGVAWRNLPDLWEITVIKAREMGQNLMAIFAVIPENLAIIATYIAGNWRELITDAINAVGTVFGNLGDNLARLAAAIVGFLTDPTKGFEFEWKPLLDGFQATAQSLPELARPALVSLQAEIDEAAGRIADREAKRASDLADRAKAAAAPAKKAAESAAKKTKDFKSEATDVSEFALKMRSAIYEGAADDTPKKQLEEQKKIRAAAEKTAQALSGGALVARLG